MLIKSYFGTLSTSRTFPNNIPLLCLGAICSQFEKMWIWLPQVLHVDVDIQLVKFAQQEYTFGIALFGSPRAWL